MLFSSVKAEGGEEAGRDRFMRLKERGRLHNTDVQGEAAGAEAAAAASDPEDLAQVPQ